MAEIVNSDYVNSHTWLKKHYGKANHCDFCGIGGLNYQWAKRKGCNYEKKRDNFMQLCISCHKVYDFTEEARENIRAAMTEYFKDKQGGKSRFAKKIYCFDINTNELLAEYDSIIDAKMYLALDSIANISRCANGKCDSAFGYKWSHSQELPKRKHYTGDIFKAVKKRWYSCPDSDVNVYLKNIHNDSQGSIDAAFRMIQATASSNTTAWRYKKLYLKTFCK